MQEVVRPAIVPSPAVVTSHRRRVLIAGAGRTGRRLAERLAEHWQITLIDLRQDRLDRVRETLAASATRANGAELRPDALTCAGDATSRLVMERAGARGADCLVAVCGDDAANLECCRLAQQEFAIAQLAAVVYEAEMLPEFHKLGVQTVLVGASLAVALANRIEPAVQASEGLGLGHGEVMELTISATSPALGRPLQSLNPQNWLIAAVYRQGRLIVPHGSTRLEEQDRVLLVGPPMLLPGIADYLRLGRARFPAPYGARMAVLLERPSETGQTAVREAHALAKQCGAEGLDMLVWGEAKRWKSWTKPLAKLLDVAPTALPAVPFLRGAADVPSEQWGCLVIPPQHAGTRRRFGWRRALLDDVLTEYGKPVLVARGSAPYRQIIALVQSERMANSSPASLRGLQAALALGSALQRPVCSLTVTAPAFVAGENVAATRQEIDQAILTLANTYRMRVERQQVVGNPIRETLARLDRHDLLVVRVPRRVGPALFRPDVGRYLALSAPCSVLVILDD